MEDRAFQAENSMDKGPKRKENKVRKLRPESLELGSPVHLILIKHLPSLPGLLLRKMDRGLWGFVTC